MAKSKAVFTKTSKVMESTSNITDLSQTASTSDRGSQLIDGVRRSHRLQGMPERAINPEMSTAGPAILGEIKPPTSASKATEAMLYNASNDIALVKNAGGDQTLGSQSSKVKEKAIPRKRKLPGRNNGDAADLPAAPAAKKKRGPRAQNAAKGISTAKSSDKKRGPPAQTAAKGISTAKSSDKPRPEPFGKPPAWAEERQALCETLDGYRAYQSGPYYHEGLGYGYLVDQAAAGRIHMDGNVIITRAGGGCDVDNNGKRTQTEDHVRSASGVACFVNNMEKGVPIVIIVGSNNAHCPTKPLHRYSVLGWFHCTYIWPETVNGKVCFMLRFEKIDLYRVSWWDSQDAEDPPQAPNFTTKAFSKTCHCCITESKQVMEPGWVCLNESCQQYNILDGSEMPEDAKRNLDFIMERTIFADFDGLPDIVPALPDPESVDATFSTERNSWKGIVCPKCKRCNSRTHWDAWRCATEGCDFVLPIKHQVHSVGSLLADNTSEYSGRALPLDKCSAPIVEQESEFIGYWRIQRYTLFTGNTITHFMANAHINRKPGGAHQILRELQEVDLGLRRFPLSNCNVKGTLTGHFSANFGMPYKFVVPQDSKAFKDAPGVIMNGLNRMTWAGRTTVTDGSFKDFNELLALGYFEKQKIGYHDDGEDDLLGTIATMSIGGDAVMKLRMKDKWFSAKALKINTYDPTAEVIPGMQGWEDRLELNNLYRLVSDKEFNAAKKKFFKNVVDEKYGKSGKSPVVVTLKLKHGDITVMDGRQLQKYFEHSIIPDGKLRYAMTCRYVKPENIPTKDHWKAEFHIDAADMYDGDPNLIQEVKENMARLAAAVVEDGPAAPEA